jgi:hypothetical protein
MPGNASSLTTPAFDGQLNHVSFWPNPAREMLYLSFESGNAQEVRWTIMNLQGQKVLHDQMHAVNGFNAQKIDVRHIAGSAVLVKVETDHEVFTKMILLVD